MKYNNYYCAKCKKNTYTRNEESVVTPMFFTCKHCENPMAESGFFQMEKMIGGCDSDPSSKIKVTTEFYMKGKEGPFARAVVPHVV